jgi:hypothetical protein
LNSNSLTLEAFVYFKFYWNFQGNKIVYINSYETLTFFLGVVDTANVVSLLYTFPMASVLLFPATHTNTLLWRVTRAMPEPLSTLAGSPSDSPQSEAGWFGHMRQSKPEQTNWEPKNSNYSLSLINPTPVTLNGLF